MGYIDYWPRYKKLPTGWYKYFIRDDLYIAIGKTSLNPDQILVKIIIQNKIRTDDEPYWIEGENVMTLSCIRTDKQLVKLEELLKKEYESIIAV